MALQPQPVTVFNEYSDGDLYSNFDGDGDAAIERPGIMPSVHYLAFVPEYFLPHNH